MNWAGPPFVERPANPAGPGAPYPKACSRCSNDFWKNTTPNIDRIAREGVGLTDYYGQGGFYLRYSARTVVAALPRQLAEALALGPQHDGDGMRSTAAMSSGASLSSPCGSLSPGVAA